MIRTEDLILLNTIGDFGFKKLESLLSAFQSTSRILSAGKRKLLAVGGIGKGLSEKISSLDEKKLSKELRLIEKLGVRVIGVFDSEYPENLKNIYSPPIVIYVKGELKPEDNDAVAIVGSRAASYYGMSTCEKLAGELASKGITVVSGLARGIDTMANKGAIRYGRSIAVLGSGLNRIYPGKNKDLAGEISKNGCVISEFPLDMPPHRGNFPRRNRIISGLSLGVLVVEAAKKSGSLITANFALNENRQVFAVPGQAGSRTSEGTNGLIKKGAKLVESVEDIIEEIADNLKFIPLTEQVESISGAACVALTEEEAMVKASLTREPAYIDEIVKKSNMNVAKVGSLLLNLEVKKIIKELPGKNFVLR